MAFGEICRSRMISQITHYESTPLQELATVPHQEKLSFRQPMGLCPKPRDLLGHNSGVRSVKEKASDCFGCQRHWCLIDAPSIWLSLVGLRPRRA
jgi:hypothetical protein